MANMNMRRGMLVAAAAACIAIAAARPAPAQDRSTCVAARVVGEAAVLREMNPLPLRPGMPLTQGDQITTGGDGRVEVLCGDGSSLVVGSRTRVRLSIFIAGNAQKRSAVLELFEGILRTVLPSGHAWEQFDIVTRTAVASVRSTTWIVDAKEDTTGVFVESGGVLVSSRAAQDQVFVPAGFGTDVDLQPGRLTTKQWGQARIDDALSRTRLP
jgi:hypothetical protein